jgi:DNA polymerase-3 subunit alpha
MGQADILRKAMGKKIMDIMNKEKPHFVEGAVAKGANQENVEKLWEKLLQFANYGFNKAHSASYAYVTYWTAWLKSNYPIEFMASLLEADLDNFNHIIIDMEECKRMGIKVLPPNINKSDFYFKVEGGKDVRFGLAGIKNVGEDIAKAIVKERVDNGLFLNLDDFLFRMAEHKVTVKAVEYFMKVGAFDEFGNRGQLISVLPTLFERYKKMKETERIGNIDLFATPVENADGSFKTVHVNESSPLPSIDDFSDIEKLQWEKDLLGLYMSSHPLDDYEEFFNEKRVTKISKLVERKENDVVVLGGTITKVRRTTTKKNENMAFVTLTDKTGSVDLVIFPRTYEQVKNELLPDVPVLFAGRINMRNSDMSIIVEKAKSLNPAKHARKFEGIVFHITEDATEDDVISLKEAIRNNPGITPVKIIRISGSEEKSMTLNNMVEMTPEILAMLKKFA